MSLVEVDLSDEDLRLLDAIKDVQNKPRAEIIRIAISDYLKNNYDGEMESAFGIWRHENEDGLTFQSTLREEWAK